MDKFFFLMGKILQAFYHLLTTKDGENSKTSLILSLAMLIALFLYGFQSLFAGVTLFGWWLVPSFVVGDAVGILTIISGLYIANRSKLVVRKKPLPLEIEMVEGEEK